MISKDRMRDILDEGRRISNQQYREHCVLNHRKTFFLFCERLSIEPPDTALLSTEFKNHIHAHLRADDIDVGSRFNPEGWFGKAWTDWNDPSKNEKNFEDEYCDVLLRLGSEPYSYQLRPEYHADIVDIFTEFRSNAEPSLTTDQGGVLVPA